jgi:hypothetical protein
MTDRSGPPACARVIELGGIALSRTHTISMVWSRE